MAHLNQAPKRPHSPRHGMDKTIRQKGYNSKEWAHTREAVLRRDNYLCQRCMEQGRLSPATCVHHIVPLSTARTEEQMMALLTDIDNCISLDEACHKAIHLEMRKKGVARW